MRNVNTGPPSPTRVFVRDSLLLRPLRSFLLGAESKRSEERLSETSLKSSKALNLGVNVSIYDDSEIEKVGTDDSQRSQKSPRIEMT
jgi:hypothetical protein